MPVGGSISDAATLSGTSAPTTGKIAFALYGPNDPTCSSPSVGTASANVTGDGTYNSGPLVPAAAGTYYFTATYSGDANNSDASTECGVLTGGGVNVTKTTPSLTTSASKAVAVGGMVTDAASVTGGFNPTGTVTYALYGPADPTCTAAPVSTSTVALTAASAPYAPTASGIHRWIATYNGDANNAPVAGKCGDAGESVSISAATPVLSTAVSASVALGGSVSDTALLQEGFRPTGTMMFKLYGPGDTNCSAAPVFTSAAIPLAMPTTPSGPYTPTAAGTYRFIATYSGDAANNSVGGACTDASEAVTVTAAATPAPGSPPPPQTVPLPLPSSPTSTKCVPATEAAQLVDSVKAALTENPGSAFKATCRGSVRIVLRSREIRPGNPGYPLKNGYTTISNTLTHGSATGQIAFSINPQGVALRKYAIDQGRSLLMFAIVHVRVDATTPSAEALRVFDLY